VHVMAPAASSKHGTWTEIIEGEAMTVHRLYSWRWYPHPWLRFALPWRIEQNSARVLDEVKPDVVHFQSHIIAGRGLSNQAKKRGIRIIGTNHFMPENLLEHSLFPKFTWEFATKTAWRAAARSFGRAEAVTSPTRMAADFLEKSIGNRRVVAISCGIDMHNYTPNMSPRTENLILFVGRITSEKQLDKLVRAFATLDPALDAHLELVGGGDQEHALRNLANSLGVKDRVTITGFVSDEYLRAALTRATVFAMPSTAELQSIATMEAMASGLPVVAANAMALPHLVHDGDNGFLFEPGNVAEFAARLTEVLTMTEDELLQLKKASLKIVAAHDINGTLDTFEKLYRGGGDLIPDSVVERPLGKRARLRAKLRELTESARIRS
jgi:glycosyltransferase involved in cell wall biosynthesis